MDEIWVLNLENKDRQTSGSDLKSLTEFFSEYKFCVLNLKITAMNVLKFLMLLGWIWSK